jgi:hypothetical protein
MGLNKEYTRYVPSNTFGAICGNHSNIKLIEHHEKVVVATGVCEYVFIWDIKRSEIVSFDLLYEEQTNNTAKNKKIDSSIDSYKLSIFLFLKILIFNQLKF